MVMLWFLYSFVKRSLGALQAVFALGLAAFSPLSVAFGRAVQPDMMMLAGSVGGLYYFYRYFEERKTQFYVLSVFLTTLAVASKAYTLYLFLPLIVIAWGYQGKKAFMDFKNYFYALIVLLTLLWYGYMWYQGKAQHLYYDTIRYNRGVDCRTFLDLFSATKVSLFLKIFFIHILTPGGTLLFFIGLFRGAQKKEDYTFYSWLTAVLLFILVTWRIVLRNPYYELALLPPAAVFVGRGAETLLQWRRGFFRRHRALLAAMLAVAIVPIVFYFYRRLYYLPDDRLSIVAAGKAVQEHTRKDELVIASYEAGPALLYYCDRKGWELDLSGSVADPAAMVEKFRAQGASVLVTTKMNLAGKAVPAENYLRSRYPVMIENSDYIIFRLKSGDA
jgi:4-amino-4-deoxy-L-arabinose transferase-like glycosyltransferase